MRRVSVENAESPERKEIVTNATLLFLRMSDSFARTASHVLIAGSPSSNETGVTKCGVQSAKVHPLVIAQER